LPTPSSDEQRYLLEAATAFPQDRFRPQEVAPHGLSTVRTAGVVAALAARRLLDGQPEQLARLTAAGRKAARRLARAAVHP
jgi:hypothetical protein